MDTVAEDNLSVRGEEEYGIGSEYASSYDDELTVRVWEFLGVVIVSVFMGK